MKLSSERSARRQCRNPGDRLREKLRERPSLQRRSESCQSWSLTRRGSGKRGGEHRAFSSGDEGMVLLFYPAFPRTQPWGNMRSHLLTSQCSKAPSDCLAGCPVFSWNPPARSFPLISLSPHSCCIPPPQVNVWAAVHAAPTRKAPTFVCLSPFCAILCRGASQS